ncbi:YceI family protein [Piscinibacter sp. HJYY11]|uniref:YceI family protein n=1 Tax=Piscinibacter sp. HJYY11 TaxID=2801333 RepID=UPI00191DE5B9|nr:YceI family protein [Piscinibacter sp. HJYY11]MBL0729517.1 YceI family protein [Piscinibacter sp. HJYY11]
MRRIPLVGGCLLSWLAFSAHAQPTTYLLDPGHTRVHWEVMHFGTSTSRGRFDDIRGSLELDATAGTGEVSIEVRTASVNTGVPPLDGVMRRSYLASEAHPVAYFVAKRWRWQRDAPLDVRGEFTLRGVSLPLSLRAAQLRCYTHPQLQREVCGADLVAELKRSDFGMTDGLPFIGDTVRLLIQVEAIRQAP